MTRALRLLRGMWWNVARRHPSDDRLLDLALDGPDAGVPPATARHLGACAPCADRVAELTSFLETLPEVADSSFEAVFTPGRLKSQRGRIDRRLAQLVGQADPGRVLRFPFAGAPGRPFEARPRRWGAVAAGIGLLLGILAGQFFHIHPVSTRNATASLGDIPRPASDLDAPVASLDMTGTVELPPLAENGAARTSPLAALTLDEFERVVPEDEFLGSLDLALTSFQVAGLQSIDALTPRVRDFAINIR